MNTTKLNKSTQKAIYYTELYNKSYCYSVDIHYQNCSNVKRNIEKAILKRMADNNCHDYKVLKGNPFCFTCGYMSHDNKKLFIETKCNIFEIAL